MLEHIATALVTVAVVYPARTLVRAYLKKRAYQGGHQKMSELGLAKCT